MTRRAPIAAAVAVVAAIGAAGWNAAAQQATDVESLTFLGKTVS